MTKFCNGCARTLPLDSFATRADRPGAHRSRCRECHARNCAIWRALNPGYASDWKVRNPSKVATYHQRQAARYAALASPAASNTNNEETTTPCPPSPA